MVIFLSIIAIIVLALAISKRNLAAIVFNATWLFILIFNSYSVGVIDAPTTEACFVILLFLLSVNIGIMLLGQRPVFFTLGKRGTDKTYILNRRLFYAVNLVAISYFFYKYTRVAIRITRSLGVFYVRYYAYNANMSYFGSTLDLYFAQHVFYALFCASSMIGILEVTRLKNIKQTIGLLLIGIMEIVLYSYTFKGRAPIVTYMVYLLMAFIIAFRFNNDYSDSDFYVIGGFNPNRIKKIIKIVIVASLIYVVVLSFSRFNGLAQIRKFMAIYLGGSVTYFSKLYDNYTPDYIPTKYVLSGIIDAIKMVFNRLFRTSMILGGNEMGAIVDVGTSIGEGVGINAACTAVFYFYKEMGVIGVGAYGALLGYISGTLQKNYYARKNTISFTLYLMFLYTLFYTYSGWSMKSLYFWLLPVIIRLLYSRRNA